MPIDDDGIVRMGVDNDTGNAYRGKGTGFEQDVLIYEERTLGQTSITSVPGSVPGSGLQVAKLTR
jgi:hypothetical protein